MLVLTFIAWAVFDVYVPLWWWIVALLLDSGANASRERS